ncbi:MAG TPA: YihY/virulence factor BrkB family protein [Gaiellaceae bacterium]
MVDAGEKVERLRDLRLRHWIDIGVGAGKSAFADHMPLLASALSYSSFFAIPSLLLLAIGIFTLAGSAATIDSVIAALHGAVPAEALDLFGASLKQIDSRAHTSVVLIVVGSLLAIWSLTGAMSAFMTAIELAYAQRDPRSFLRKRLVALELVGFFLLALALVCGLLVFGPTLSAWVGRKTTSESLVGWIWWGAEWPLLIGALLSLLTIMLWLAPAQRPSWQVLFPGALLATLIWILSSAGFAFFTATYGTYNKTWGSLSAVIVTLVWLWLTALALLLGAELNAEAARRVGRRAA